MKHYRPLPGSDKEVAISLSFIRDDHNWYRAEPQRRGFYLSFMPVEREQREGGITITRIAPQEGGNYRILLKETRVQNRKTEARLEQFIADHLDSLHELYIADDRVRLFQLVTSGQLPPEALPQAA